MSNETTLDDVLALEETWRMRSEGLSFVMDAEEATDRCADDLEALLPAIKAALEDARRYRRSEEHTSELQSLMRISYAVFCLKQKNIEKNRVINKYTNRK